MLRIAMVVEGDGDVKAFPTLVAKIGRAFGVDVVAPNPIKAGNAVKLSRPGELERFAIMAASRQDVHLVLVVVDLDDGCAAQQHSSFVGRCESISRQYGKDIRVCFAVREYECWLLSNVHVLKLSFPELAWAEDFSCPNPSGVRGAKEAFGQAIGRRYREITDQPAFTKKIDPLGTFLADRSFRKLVRSITGIEYATLRDRAELYII